VKNTSAGEKKILVVEDELAITDLYQKVLASEGFEVDVAVNGKVAQGMIEEKQYELCLIDDIRTPVMNGKELYAWLKDKHPRLATAAIFTTGDVMGGDTQSFIKHTGRPFLPKPFKPDELKKVAERVLKELRK